MALRWMAEHIRLTASDGFVCDAYVARPVGVPKGGIVVVQEIFGVNPHIRSVADRYAAEGYLAVAPALFDRAEPGFQSGYQPEDVPRAYAMIGKVSSGPALLDIAAAIQFAAQAGKVGVVGFCMGGGLALVVACQRPDAVAAAAPYYGAIPWESAQPNWSALTATVVGEYAENDGWASPEAARALEAQLRDLGKEATMHIHPACDHAFFNDTRPEVYDAAASAVAFERTVGLFRSTL